MLLDGGLGTELERVHRPLSGTPLWSGEALLEAPDRVKQVHRSFLQAGADCIASCSYQISRASCAEHGLDAEQTDELMRSAAELAVEARDAFWSETLDDPRTEEREKPLVAGSVGPYGAVPVVRGEYRGDYGLSVDELAAFHRPHVEILATSEVDLLAFETIPCWAEAEALLQVLANFPDRVAWFSFTARDELHISQGEVFADCVERLSDHPQVAAIGINCTPPGFLPALIHTAANLTSKPIAVYPNSGETYSIEDAAWHGTSYYEAIESHAETWHKNGARILGGCCRTSAQDIARLARWRSTL